MKFVISSTELLSRLQTVSRVISSKSTIPALLNFLFEVQGETLTITASDLETTMRAQLQLNNVEGEGKIAVEAKRLTDILKEFPEQPLILEANLDSLAVDIISDNGKFSIMGQSGDEYPTLQGLDEANTTTMTMPGSALLKGITKTLFATADDDLRPVMNGISIIVNDSSITFAASDAHKLVRFRNTSVNSPKEASFILPKKPADTLKNILPKEANDITMKFDDKNAHFRLSNYEMICRLVEGQYPNYEAIIPNNNPNRLTLNRLDFLNTLKRVSVFASQASNLVKLELKSDHVIVSAQDIDFSISAYEKVSAQYDGEEMNIGFKSAFLIQILSAITSENVVVEMSDPSRSGIILPLEQDSDTENELMLLMPMMIND
jgi:DNA polymerase-3 subunit beta